MAWRRRNGVAVNQWRGWRLAWRPASVSLRIWPSAEIKLAFFTAS
jgi:hypothetical protein